MWTVKIGSKNQIKIIAALVCVLGAAFIFLLYVPERPDITMFYGLDLIVLWYPLTAVIYGGAVTLASFRDARYIGILAVVFLVLAVLNTVIHDFVELPAAFIYTAIAEAGGLVSWGIGKIIRGTVSSYRAYMEKSRNSYGR